MAYVREKFEDLDVMNYFLFNQLTTQPEIREKFCKCIIRNLIGKEVSKITVQAEKIEFPDDPTKRGVRLDVEVKEVKEDETIATIYDIEPHRDKESEYPKKNRFTQAQIDKNNLASGDNNFAHLPDLYIISITNYDPYGRDRMLYTIKNSCVEEPDLEYNDGVKILYFNTTGKRGGTKDLQQFLQYLEESCKSNVVNTATEEVDKYVDEIKHNYEIGGKYMTVGDLMDKIVAEAVEDAVADKEAEIADKDAKLADKDAKIKELEEEVKRLRESKK